MDEPESWAGPLSTERYRMRAKLQGDRWLRNQRLREAPKGVVGLGVKIEVFASLALQKGGGGPSRLGQADLDGQASQQARKMRRKCRRSASSLLRPALSLTGKSSWAAGNEAARVWR